MGPFCGSYDWSVDMRGLMRALRRTYSVRAQPSADPASAPPECLCPAWMSVRRLEIPASLKVSHSCHVSGAQRAAVSVTRLAYDESGLPPSDAALQQLHAYKKNEFKPKAPPNPLAHLIAKRPNNARSPAQGYRQFGVWHVVQIEVGVTTKAQPQVVTRQLWPWLTKVEVEED